MSELEAVFLSLLGMVLAGVLGFRLARGRSQTVEAEEFVVRDGTGRRRAKLGMSDDGGVRLRLLDENGVCCVSLGVTPEEHARLHLYDQQGALRAGLGVFPEDAGVGAVFHDQGGRPRMTVSVLDAGGADIRVFDEDGKVQWKTR